MLFTWRDCEDLKVEIRLIGVKGFSWYKISVYRKAFFLKLKQ
jgi:hypothetical protein